MMTYDLSDAANGRSLYARLYRCIKNDVISGVLPAGTQLPSKRALAKHLGVSTITVENAYGQLVSEGYLRAEPKRGYFVEALPVPTRTRPGAGTGVLPPAAPPPEVDLSGSRTAPENFPFSVWARLMRETLSNDQAALMQPSPCGGVLPLREAIAAHLLAFRGMTAHPDQIVVGAGTELLYGLLIQLLGRDKRVCVETPGYSKIVQVYRSHGVTCRLGRMDEQGLCVAALADSEIAHISPTHHFPTGITMPVSRRYELLSWANGAEGRYIIEDDYDSELRLNGHPIPALQSIDVGEKVIYMNTFSKSLSSTVRISYMVLPPHLAERYYRTLSFYACTVPNFEQYTLEKFIRRGYLEKHINRMRLYYVRQRQAVFDCIAASPLAARCAILERDSGLHFLLELDTALPDAVLSDRLLARGVRLTPLSAYDPTSAGDCHQFVVNYSNLALDRLPEVLRTVCELL